AGPVCQNCQHADAGAPGRWRADGAVHPRPSQAAAPYLLTPDLRNRSALSIMPPSPRTATTAAVDRVRLDVALVERGLVASREKAQALVVAGLVMVEGRPAEGVAEPVARDTVLTVESRAGFGSRGGATRERALA